MKTLYILLFTLTPFSAQALTCSGKYPNPSKPKTTSFTVEYGQVSDCVNIQTSPAVEKSNCTVSGLKMEVVNEAQEVVVVVADADVKGTLVEENCLAGCHHHKVDAKLNAVDGTVYEIKYFSHSTLMSPKAEIHITNGADTSSYESISCSL